MIFGTFFTITGDNVSTMLGYVQGLITDMIPLILPVVAVGIGMLVIWVLIKALTGR